MKIPYDGTHVKRPPSDRHSDVASHLPRRSLQDTAASRCSRWPCLALGSPVDPRGLVIENRAWCGVAGIREESASTAFFSPLLGRTAPRGRGVSPRQISASQRLHLNGRCEGEPRSTAGQERSKADQARQPSRGPVQGCRQSRSPGEPPPGPIQHLITCSRFAPAGWPSDLQRPRMTTSGDKHRQPRSHPFQLKLTVDRQRQAELPRFRLRCPPRPCSGSSLVSNRPPGLVDVERQRADSWVLWALGEQGGIHLLSGNGGSCWYPQRRSGRAQKAVVALAPWGVSGRQSVQIVESQGDSPGFKPK